MEQRYSISFYGQVIFRGAHVLYVYYLYGGHTMRDSWWFAFFSSKKSLANWHQLIQILNECKFDEYVHCLPILY